VSRTFSYELDGFSIQRIQHALTDIQPERQPIDLPKPKPVELLSRCRLQPVPVHSQRHLTALAAQRVYDGQQADKAIRNGRVS
jgi:hypothetical protein